MAKIVVSVEDLQHTGGDGFDINNAAFTIDGGKTVLFEYEASGVKLRIKKDDLRILANAIRSGAPNAY